jgi:hypothetical protein
MQLASVPSLVAMSQPLVQLDARLQVALAKSAQAWLAVTPLVDPVLAPVPLVLLVPVAPVVPLAPLLVAVPLVPSAVPVEVELIPLVPPGHCKHGPKAPSL